MCIVALTLVRVAEAAAGVTLGSVRTAAEVFPIRAARRAEVEGVEEVVRFAYCSVSENAFRRSQPQLSVEMGLAQSNLSPLFLADRQEMNWNYMQRSS